MSAFLTVIEGGAPLLLSIPHTGLDIPGDIGAQLINPWLARRDADYHVERLYAFASAMGATIVRTQISRTVIDVNRDPSGASLYPGQTVTGLCPAETFDGEALYRGGRAPDGEEIARRRIAYYEPFHAAMAHQLARLKRAHKTVVLYDAHSIRSRIPRLFDGLLPHFNIGTNCGASCAPGLQRAAEAICAASGRDWVSNGRFKGGWITRHYGAPQTGVHAIQMELACRGYLREPEALPTPDNWPAGYDPGYAAPLSAILRDILAACLAFARTP